MKPYPEFPGYYVTVDGTIYTDKCGPELVQLAQRMKDGYLHVRFQHLGKRVQRAVHRMVALTYLGPSDLTVNHKDCNKINNTLNNLEYLSSRENTAHAWSYGRFPTGSRHKRSKLSDGKLLGLMTLRGKVRQKVAAELYGVSQSLVSILWAEEGRAGQSNYRRNRGRARKYEQG